MLATSPGSALRFQTDSVRGPSGASAAALTCRRSSVGEITSKKDSVEHPFAK